MNSCIYKGWVRHRRLAPTRNSFRYRMFMMYLDLAELPTLHQRYQSRGLVIVGFPSDDFNQEAHDEAETAQVCFQNFGVTFTMLSPLPVKGKAANPVFLELARQTVEPGWNFNKYLVRPDGTVVAHFDSDVTPESAQLNKAIEALLAAPGNTQVHAGGT